MIDSDFKFKPFSNFVVLDVTLKREERAGSIIVPETVEKPVIESTVVAISDEKDKEGSPLVKNVKVGDHVLFNLHSGYPIKVWGKEYLILRETELYGSIELDPSLTDYEVPGKVIRLHKTIN